MKNYLSRLLFILLIIVISGCSHTVHLPVTQKTYQQCSFNVIDERSQPDYLYIVSEGNAVKAKIEPSLHTVIKNSVCNKLNDSNEISFFINDYECLMTGFFEVDYIVNIRGRLEYKGEQYDLHVNNVHTESSGYEPPACEAATKPLINELTDSILKKIESNQ